MDPADKAMVETKEREKRVRREKDRTTKGVVEFAAEAEKATAGGQPLVHQVRQRRAGDWTNGWSF